MRSSIKLLNTFLLTLCLAQSSLAMVEENELVADCKTKIKQAYPEAEYILLASNELSLSFSAFIGDRELQFVGFESSGQCQIRRVK